MPIYDVSEAAYTKMKAEGFPSWLRAKGVKIRVRDGVPATLQPRGKGVRVQVRDNVSTSPLLNVGKRTQVKVHVHTLPSRVKRALRRVRARDALSNVTPHKDDPYKQGNNAWGGQKKQEPDLNVNQTETAAHAGIKQNEGFAIGGGDEGNSIHQLKSALKQHYTDRTKKRLLRFRRTKDGKYVARDQNGTEYELEPSAVENPNGSHYTEYNLWQMSLSEPTPPLPSDYPYSPDLQPASPPQTQEEVGGVAWDSQRSKPQVPGRHELALGSVASRNRAYWGR